MPSLLQFNLITSFQILKIFVHCMIPDHVLYWKISQENSSFWMPCGFMEWTALHVPKTNCVLPHTKLQIYSNPLLSVAMKCYRISALPVRINYSTFSIESNLQCNVAFKLPTNSPAQISLQWNLLSRHAVSTKFFLDIIMQSFGHRQTAKS